MPGPPPSPPLSPSSSPGSSPPPDRRRAVGLWLYALHLLSLVAIALSNVFLGLCVLAAPWTLRRASSREAGRARWRNAWRGLPPGSGLLLAALGAYVLFLAASILASYNPARSLRAASEVLTLAAVPLGLFLLRRTSEVRRLVDGVVVVATLVAGAGLTQFLVGYGDIDNRIRGPLSHYMTFSGVLLLADLLLLARMTTGGSEKGREPWRSPWRWGALVLINVALLGSYTRSAWVGLAVAAVVLISLKAPRYLAALPAAALIFLLLAPVPLLARIGSITDLSDESNYDRLCMAWAGTTMVAERPIFGLGPRMVRELYPLYRLETAPRYTVPHLHNSYLELAAERGLPALAAYLWLMGIAALHAWRRFRAEGGMAGPRADLYVGAFLALLAFHVAGLFENNWGDTEVQRLALFVLILPFVAGGESGSIPPPQAGDRD